MKRVESCAIALMLSGCLHTKLREDAVRANVTVMAIGVALIAVGAWTAHKTWQNPDAEPPDLIPAEATIVGGTGFVLGGLIGMALSHDDTTPPRRQAGPPGAPGGQ